MSASTQLRSAYPVPALRPTNVGRYEEVTLERSHDGRVATITWDPPKPLNPLSVALTDELVAAVEEVAADERLHVVIFRGAGGCFSAGDDLVEIHEGMWGDPNQTMRRIRFYQRFANTIEDLDKITVAVAEGFVLGGGLEITMACDLAMIAESCRWGMPEVDSAMTPGWGGTTRMIRLIEAAARRRSTSSARCSRRSAAWTGACSTMPSPTPRSTPRCSGWSRCFWSRTSRRCAS